MGSLVVAFVLVFFMLLIAYRASGDVRLAVPIALTVAALLASSRCSGINLNLVTAIASSIVIGVAIDYAIHFVAAIENQKTDGGPGYVLRAIDKAGRPIVANALGIAVGNDRTVALAVPHAPAHLDDHVGLDDDGGVGDADDHSRAHAARSEVLNRGPESPFRR